MSYQYYPDSLYFISYKTFNALDFFKSDSNKQILKEQFYKASDKFDFNIIAYAIMSNHYHLLVEIKNGKDSQNHAIKLINGGSSFRIEKPAHTEKVWGSNNKHSIAILDDDAIFMVLGYIVGNPLRHGMVKDFDELDNYQYCNYKEVKKQYNKELIDNLILKSSSLNFESIDSYEHLYKSIQGL